MTGAFLQEVCQVIHEDAETPDTQLLPTYNTDLRNTDPLIREETHGV